MCMAYEKNVVLQGIWNVVFFFLLFFKGIYSNNIRKTKIENDSIKLLKR